MNNYFDNKTILVTGGTGSFGKSFIKFLLDNKDIKKVIVFSRDELKQYHMAEELTDKRLRFFIGDVRDLPRLQRAFKGVDIVVHAAALKQVPALEYNPFEAVKTNILGSQNVIEAAIDCGVNKAVLISTDKAAHPGNLYGSTKLCAEKLFVAANSYAGEKTQFGVVRYGNVLGSRGSIVDTLIKNRKSGKVKITHEEMTRFWISLKETCQLVVFAIDNMEGGEIFIPKIKSMKLIDLVKAIAPKAKREIIGMRAGEKLHEVLLTNEEARHSIELEKYYVILPEFSFWSDDSYKKYNKLGSKVDPEFSLVSHENKLWFTPQEIRGIVNNISES